jgi:hypothetical protein
VCARLCALLARRAMSLELSLAVLFAALIVAVLANWRERRPRELVHRSRQKIHPSLAVHAAVPQYSHTRARAGVNLLNASVH